MQFFELLVSGQRKIRELWKQQVEQQRKADRLRNRKENVELGTEGMEVDNMAQYNEDEQYEQQMIIKSNMIFFFLAAYLSSCETYNVNFSILFFFLVMPDGSMYAAEHEMSLQMEGLTKPRRKRGRPPKVHTETDSMVCNNKL